MVEQTGRIREHRTTKWYERNDAKCPSLAYVVLVLCPQTKSYRVKMLRLAHFSRVLRCYFACITFTKKKIRQLGDIVNDLKEVFELPTCGNIPVRSQGSRWINHKRKALQQVVDRYGAYSPDSTDRTCLSQVRR